MAHIIAEPCIGTKDTACVEVCPVNCIHPAKGENGNDSATQLYIDPDECIDCGACLDECPAGAIHQEYDVPAEEHADIAANARFFAERRARA